MTQRMTVDRFCKALVGQLLTRHTTHLRFDDIETSKALRGVLEVLDGEARTALSLGDAERSYDLLNLLDRLSPNPSTGAFDGFWAALRDLQPAFAEVRNPLYRALELKGSPASARRVMDDLPLEWQQIVSRSADALEQFAA